jgi:hypothetical protein
VGAIAPERAETLSDRPDPDLWVFGYGATRRSGSKKCGEPTFRETRDASFSRTSAVAEARSMRRA